MPLHSDRLTAPVTFWISVARATHVMHLERASTLIPRCRRLSWNDSKVRKAAPLFSNNTVSWQLTAVLAALAVGDLLVRFGSMFICIVSAWSRSCWTGRPGGHGWKGPSWNDYWGGFGHRKSCRCAGAGAGSDQNAPKTSKDHKETMP